MTKLKEFVLFINHLLQNRQLIFRLIQNDFKKQYLGSYFGLFWAFAQPISYMLVIWLVFTYGLRSVSHGNMPYFLWLMSGMIPWFFLASALQAGTNSIVSNSFLVKKVAFRVSILPLVQISSALILHIGLLLFLIIIFFLYGYTPSIYWLQLPYYIFFAFLVTLSISWLSASFRVFIKDVSNFVTVMIQIGFWATPIFWNIEQVPEKYQWILELNPAFYIIKGYRDVFINHKWFWETPTLTLFFMIMTFSTFIIGAIIFRKLRPHFGDVL